MKFSDDLLTPEQVREIFDSLATRAASFRRINHYYHQLLGEMIGREVRPGSRVLDLGSGTGDLLAALAPAKGVGVDISPAMVELARSRNPEYAYCAADMQETIPDGDYDYVVICNSIGFLTDIQRAFRLIRSRAGSDTRLVITHYNHLWEFLLKIGERIGIKMPEPYQNWLAREDLVNLLELEGFAVVRAERGILLPRKIPVLAELCNRFLVKIPLFWRLALVEMVVAVPRDQQGVRQDHSCSVIIPARNERGTIGEIVARIPEMGSWTELIFVEGHSVDGTYEEIERVAAANPRRRIRFFKQNGVGKADAVREGFRQAEGDVMMILDADMTVLPEELPRFYDVLAEGRGDLVMGTRLVYRMQRDSMRFLNLLGNRFFSRVISLLLGQRVTDTLCGTKAVRRVDYLRMESHLQELAVGDPFGDFELIFAAALASLRIVEIPVHYHSRLYGETQISRFRHGFQLLKMVIRAFSRFKFR